jgi:hypothetical protein
MKPNFVRFESEEPPPPASAEKAKTERVQLVELTQRALEQKLSVTPMTIYLWRKEGLPVIKRKVGDQNRIFFAPAQVRRWLEANRPRQLEKLATRLAIDLLPQAQAGMLASGRECPQEPHSGASLTEPPTIWS